MASLGVDELLEELEVVAATLALALGVFAYLNRATLRSVPHSGLLTASVGTLAASLVCSVVEDLAWGAALNLLQHALMPASFILLAIWCWLVFVRPDAASS